MQPVTTESEPNAAPLGGVETGGTSVSCAAGTGPDDLRALEQFPTTTPEETVERIIGFFRENPVSAIGVGSFGPVDPDPASPTWGHVTDTPKPGWSGAPVAPRLRVALGVPVAFDTDVNAAALGEARWGVGHDADPLVYVTVGTGLGAGVLVGGRPVHGNPHPEAGHIRLPRDPARDPFTGACPFHGDCWEGLASGTAMYERWGIRGEQLPDDHEGWALEAHYLALGVVNLALIASPQCIVLGGGVMRKPGLIDAVRGEVEALLAGYIAMPRIELPALDGRQGVLGGIALAEGALADARAILSA
jgi:fructokinase